MLFFSYVLVLSIYCVVVSQTCWHTQKFWVRMVGCLLLVIYSFKLRFYNEYKIRDCDTGNLLKIFFVLPFLDSFLDLMSIQRDNVRVRQYILSDELADFWIFKSHFISFINPKKSWSFHCKNLSFFRRKIGYLLIIFCEINSSNF